MAVVDANYTFLMVDVGANGRVSDGGVLKNTLFWRKLSENQLNMPDARELPDTPNKKIPVPSSLEMKPSNFSLNS